MTYRGTVKGGVVVLDEPARLPEGTAVDVRPVEEPEDDGPVWGDVLREFIGQVSDLPKDMARNHDHYLHGAPKR